MLKRLKEFFSFDRYFYGLLIFLIIFIGQLPIILHFFHTPKGYYYPLLQDNVSFSDYYYLALIRFGMGSEWLLRIPYVVTPHKASLIQAFYVVLGKISFLTGIGPAEIYAIFRVLGGVIFAVSAAYFLKMFLSKNQARLAFIFFILAEPWPFINGNITSFFNQTFGKWVWHFGEAARRISVMPPHYTVGKGLAVLSLVLLIHYLKKRSTSDSSTIPGVLASLGHLGGVLAALLIFLAGVIYPPPVFIVLFSLTISYIFYIAITKREMGEMRVMRGIIIFLLGAILPLMILKAELAKGYPWDMWNRVELGWNSPAMNFEWEYLHMLGILVLFVPFSLPAIFKREKTGLDYSRLFILIWFISAFFLFPFADILKLGKFRFTEGAQIVPLAILSLWGFNFLSQKIQKFRFVFLPIFLLNFAVFTTLSLLWSTKSLWPFWTNVYIRPQEVAALKYLENQTSKDAIVLADTYPSNFIPAFAQVRTIIGFSDFYPEFSQFKDEESKIQNILYGNLAERQVKEYLLQRNVDYVYRDTSAFGKKVLYPQFLDIVFQNDLFVVYKVNRQMLQ